MRTLLTLLRREAPMAAGLAVLITMAALPLLAPLVVDPGLAAIGSVPPRRPPGGRIGWGPIPRGATSSPRCSPRSPEPWRSVCSPG
jgi:hypothetical protein